MIARKKLVALAVLAASGLLAGAVIFEGGPSAIIYPKQLIPIRFDHNYHTREANEEKGIAGEGLSCDFCHENVSAQSKPGETDIPGHEVCENCHGDWIGDEKNPAEPDFCRRCHKDLSAKRPNAVAKPLLIPAPNIKFSHEQHVKADVQCTQCHSQVPKKKLATRDDYPTMDRCIACHQEKGISTECSTCHLTGASGKLITKFATGTLKPVRYFGFAAHTGDFLRDHAVPAQRQQAFCQSCHTQDDCLACHDGVNRDQRYHPGDWIAVHGIRSRVDDFRCQSCHNNQSFCLGCHVKSGVASISDAANPLLLTRQTVRVDQTGAPSGPHPMAAEGWLSPASRNFHGFHAQRSIRACVSCHQEQYCLRCHASNFPNGTPSLGGNPHGPNPERLKGSGAASNNARACMKCHSPFDPAWR